MSHRLSKVFIMCFKFSFRADYLIHSDWIIKQLFNRSLLVSNDFLLTLAVIDTNHKLILDERGRKKRAKGDKTNKNNNMHRV